MIDKELNRNKWLLKEDLDVTGFFNKIFKFNYLHKRLLKTLPKKEKAELNNNLKKNIWFDINSKLNVIVDLQKSIKKEYEDMIEKKNQIKNNENEKVAEKKVIVETHKEIEKLPSLKDWKPDKYYIDNFLIPIEMLDYGHVHLYKYYANKKFICYLFTNKDDYKIYCDDTNTIEEIAERDFEIKIHEFEEQNKNNNPFGEKSFDNEDEVDISNVTSVMNSSTPSTLSGTDIF